MSFYSKEGRFSFIHTPKTGGSSIRDMLSAAWPDATYIAPCHTEAAKVRAMVPDGTFLFGFVRNPYEWVESLRRYVSLMPGSVLYEYIQDPVEFTSELWAACSIGVMTENGPILFQREVVAGCDKVYRFEDMEGAATDIGERLGRIMPLEHKNANGAESIDVEGEYRECISSLFAKDFRAFNYTP